MNAGIMNMGRVASNFIIPPRKPVGITALINIAVMIETLKASFTPYRKNAKTHMTPTKSIFIPQGVRRGNTSDMTSNNIANAERIAVLTTKYDFEVFLDMSYAFSTLYTDSPI
jgi:hypothetical protein